MKFCSSAADEIFVVLFPYYLSHDCSIELNCFVFLGAEFDDPIIDFFVEVHSINVIEQAEKMCLENVDLSALNNRSKFKRMLLQQILFSFHASKSRMNMFSLCSFCKSKINVLLQKQKQNKKGNRRSFAK